MIESGVKIKKKTIERRIFGTIKLNIFEIKNHNFSIKSDIFLDIRLNPEIIVRA